MGWWRGSEVQGVLHTHVVIPLTTGAGKRGRGDTEPLPGRLSQPSPTALAANP